LVLVPAVDIALVGTVVQDNLVVAVVDVVESVRIVVDVSLISISLIFR